MNDSALKRLLLPVWNRGAQALWRSGELIAALARGRVETCIVCGNASPMAYRRWLITPKLAEIGGWSAETAEAFARKESLICAFCGSKLRNRRLARAILDLFPTRSGACRSFREWTRSPEAAGLAIAEVNGIDGLHDYLKRLPGVRYSEYQPEAGSAARCEDLCALSYPDATFDIVLSSETLEHVPDLERALGEILRVLKPGGVHAFTIPRAPGVENTFTRARLSDEGTLIHQATPLHHPNGDSGYFVFTEFGDDCGKVFEAAGFRFEERFGPISERDVAQVYLTWRPA